MHALIHKLNNFEYYHLLSDTSKGFPLSPILFVILFSFTLKLKNTDVQPIEWICSSKFVYSLLHLIPYFSMVVLAAKENIEFNITLIFINIYILAFTLSLY